MRKRILCFGDSNTFGTIPALGGRYSDEKRWTGVMQAELGDDYTVITEGYGGRTTVFFDPIENKMSGIDYFYPCVESQKPLDLIIIMLGTNDLKPRFSVNAGDIAQSLINYANIIKNISAEYGQPELLIAAPILIDPVYKKDPVFHDMFGEDASERSLGFADAFRSAAKALGAHFINAADHAKASSADGIHMDEAEHLKLGKAMAEKVRELTKGTFHLSYFEKI